MSGEVPEPSPERPLRGMGSRRRRRGQKIAAVTIAAMVLLGLCISVLRIPAANLAGRYEKLEREFWSTIRPQPRQPGDPNGVSIRTADAEFSMDAGSVDIGEVRRIGAEADAVLARMEHLAWWISCIFAVQGLLVFPFILGVYWATPIAVTSGTVARVTALLSIPLALVYVAIGVGYIENDIVRGLWPAYPIALLLSLGLLLYSGRRRRENPSSTVAHARERSPG